MRRKPFAVLAGIVAASTLPGHPVAQPAEAMQLDVVERGVSSVAARRMVTTCLDFAASAGWKVQVAVVDRSGALVAFGRSDGASSASQDISLAKARTAARLGWSTEQFARYGWDADTRSPGPLAFVPGFNGIAGGLPIHTPKGDHIGGIGVSGSLPANDLQCAEASIRQVGASTRAP